MPNANWSASMRTQTGRWSGAARLLLPQLPGQWRCPTPRRPPIGEQEELAASPPAALRPPLLRCSLRLAGDLHDAAAAAADLGGLAYADLRPGLLCSFSSPKLQRVTPSVLLCVALHAPPMLPHTFRIHTSELRHACQPFAAVDLLFRMSTLLLAFLDNMRDAPVGRPPGFSGQPDHRIVVGVLLPLLSLVQGGPALRTLMPTAHGITTRAKESCSRVVSIPTGEKPITG